jgi:hypothetical protein
VIRTPPSTRLARALAQFIDLGFHAVRDSLIHTVAVNDQLVVKTSVPALTRAGVL